MVIRSGRARQWEGGFVRVEGRRATEGEGSAAFDAAVTRKRNQPSVLPLLGARSGARCAAKASTTVVATDLKKLDAPLQ